MSVFRNASQGTLNTRMVVAACLAVVVGIAWSGTATAQTTIDWSGATSTDFGNGANWVGGSVPAGTGNNATIPSAANNPTLSSGNYSMRRLNVGYGGVFTMQSGSLQLDQGGGNTRFSVGSPTGTGTATFNMVGGNVTTNGQLIVVDDRSSNNSVGVYNQSGGRFYANVAGTDGIQFATSGGNVGYRAYVTITGGTTVSARAINFGQSVGNGNAAFMTGTISGGVLMATRYASTSTVAAAPNDDDFGTLRFQGGGFKFSGGQMIGTDTSCRDGFRVGTGNSSLIAPQLASGTVGIEYAGGMMQIYTNRTEGTLYFVQTSALQGAPTDPVPAEAFTSVAMNRGFSRGITVSGPNTSAAWTSLANTAIKANVLTGVNPASNEGNISQVASIAAFDIADYNTDGVVDQGDYVSWYGQNGLTYSGGAPVDIQTVLNNDLPLFGADGNGDSKVDDADLTVYQGRIGQRRTDGAMQFAKDQTIDVASGSVSQSDPGYTVSSNVDNLNLTTFNGMNTKAFTKTGSGELVFTGENNLTYGATISNGKLRLSGSQAVVTSWSGTTTVQTGATLQVDAGATAISQTINVAGGNLTVNPGGNLSMTVTSATSSTVSQTFGSGVVVSNTGSVTLSNSTPQTVNVQSLTVDTATGGKVDIGRGTVNIASGNAAELVADIVAGRNDGTWNGASGISSSAAAAEEYRAVGWIDNGGGSLTVGFGAAGDVNLDGYVDFSDVVQFVGTNLYNTDLPATWADGDYDYNGVVDFSDVLALVSANLYNTGAYNTAPLGGASLVGGGIVAVPEPATWVLVAMGAACVAGRSVRRRSMLRV
jgi:autotransporter-associated beta strand protein